MRVRTERNLVALFQGCVFLGAIFAVSSVFEYMTRTDDVLSKPVRKAEHNYQKLIEIERERMRREQQGNEIPPELR